MPTTLTPDTLDNAAAALYDTAAWQQIVTNYRYTAPEPVTRQTSTATEATQTPHPATPDQEAWRTLLSVPVDQLITTALRTIPADPPPERPLPGRLGAILPDRLHAWRRIGQADLRPSVHLAYARQLIVEWGWQNQPYQLRNRAGARCICGSILTAHRLGFGSEDTMNRAGAWLLTELRKTHDWNGLIGPWNRAPGRTADQALGLIDATIRRASHAGE